MGALVVVVGMRGDGDGERARSSLTVGISNDRGCKSCDGACGCERGSSGDRRERRIWSSGPGEGDCDAGAITEGQSSPTERAGSWDETTLEGLFFLS